jgi:hypothetical protein
MTLFLPPLPELPGLAHGGHVRSHPYQHAVAWLGRRGYDAAVLALAAAFSACLWDRT